MLLLSSRSFHLWYVVVFFYLRSHNSALHMGESTSVEVVLPMSAFQIDRGAVVIMTKQRPPAGNVEQWFGRTYVDAMATVVAWCA